MGRACCSHLHPLFPAGRRQSRHEMSCCYSLSSPTSTWEDTQQPVELSLWQCQRASDSQTIVRPAIVLCNTSCTLVAWHASTHLCCIDASRDTQQLRRPPIYSPRPSGSKHYWLLSTMLRNMTQGQKTAQSMYSNIWRLAKKDKVHVNVIGPRQYLQHRYMRLP